LVGTWEAKSSCLKTSGTFDISGLGVGCKTAEISGTINVTGTWTATADKKYTDKTITTGSDDWKLAPACLTISGTTTDCVGIARVLTGTLETYGYEEIACSDASGGGCTCKGKINQTGGMGLLYNDLQEKGSFTTSGNTFSMGDPLNFKYCVKGTELTVTPQATSPTLNGTIVFQNSGSPGGAGGSSANSTGAGGSSSVAGGPGGSSSVAGGPGGSSSGAGGPGGSSTAKGGSGGGGTTSSSGKGGTQTASGGIGGKGGTTSTGGTTVSTSVPPGDRTGPCDIYADAKTPCVGAYSTIRALSKSYSGPLFQVRAGSSSTNNTNSGGTTKDIGMTADGYVDSSALDAACGSTYCTVSVLYDQSGKKNDLVRATKGPAGNGDRTAYDDYESIANSTKAVVTAGGHKGFGLYMNKFEGYRSAFGVKANGVPVGGSADQGIYMLADGTHYGTACCWDFGNATPDPNKYGDMNTIFFGTGFWGKGDGKGPWFLCDFEGGVWAGGSGGSGTANPKNPSMPVPFALGMVKTNSGKYAIRVADVQKATDLTTAYDGQGPRTLQNQGGILLGIGGDNSNNSWGTFYEGAVTAGRPSDDTELSVLKNIKTVGYIRP
jgi:hypothetical protein